jgi:hypothetical protein
MKILIKDIDFLMLFKKIIRNQSMCVCVCCVVYFFCSKKKKIFKRKHYLLHKNKYEYNVIKKKS